MGLIISRCMLKVQHFLQISGDFYAHKLHLISMRNDKLLVSRCLIDFKAFKQPDQFALSNL